MPTKTVIRKIGRNAENGQICSLNFAMKHPNITTIETRKFKYKTKNKSK